MTKRANIFIKQNFQHHRDCDDSLLENRDSIPFHSNMAKMFA